MEFFEAVEKRRSVRAFLDKPVEQEKLRRILEAANAAPSAGGLQAYEIMVVTREETRKRLSKAAWNEEMLVQAPVVLVFIANPAGSEAKYGKRGAEFYCVQDATIAAAYAQLAATAQGLSSCWVGGFNEAEVKRISGLSNVVPVALIPIGYAGENPGRTQRKSLTDLVREEL